MTITFKILKTLEIVGKSNDFAHLVIKKQAWQEKNNPGCGMNHAKPLEKAMILHIWQQNAGPRLRKVHLTTRIRQNLENRWQKQ